jgi:hypothetical protein
MKRFLAAGALVASVAAALFAARAGAIINGTPDGNQHKGVGYIVFYDAADVPLWRCSGALVSQHVVLTAGHCAGKFDNSTGVHQPAFAQIWFDKNIKLGSYPSNGPAQTPPVSCLGFKGYPCSGGDSLGVPFAHPLYQGSQESGTVNDIGVVVLLKQQSKHDVLDLAPVGTLDRTAPGSLMTIVGYGLQQQPPPVVDRQRMQGKVKFIRTEDGSQPDDDPAFADFTNGYPGGSAACAGDSGGPVIDGDGDIVAVMALLDPFVDGFCTGGAFHYRTDTQDSKRFLARFGVSVPGNGRDDDGGHHGHHGHDLAASF